MKIEVEAPWTNGEVKKYDGILGMFYQYKEQLLYYQKQNDTEHIRLDIAGYDMILESNSESNAREFLRIKTDAKLSGTAFKNNLAVIGELKKLGLWE